MSTPPATPTAAAPLVQFDQVSKRYGSFRLALADVSFSVARGELLLLTGASGAGKSTVLRLIAALDAPSSGIVRVAGQDVSRLRRSALPLLRRSMGIVLQDLMLLDDRDVRANVMLPALATGVAPGEARARADAALARAGLPSELHALRPGELSGGEQQRAALARAMVNRPALLLADEPAAHLDDTAAAAIFETLSQFAAAGVTVIVATHARPAALAADRELNLREGRLANGHPDEVPAEAAAA